MGACTHSSVLQPREMRAACHIIHKPEQTRGPSRRRLVPTTKPHRHPRINRPRPSSRTFANLQYEEIPLASLYKAELFSSRVDYDSHVMLAVSLCVQCQSIALRIAFRGGNKLSLNNELDASLNWFSNISGGWKLRPRGASMFRGLAHLTRARTAGAAHARRRSILPR